jgi:hypothetical protein
MATKTTEPAAMPKKTANSASENFSLERDKLKRGGSTKYQAERADSTMADNPGPKPAIRDAITTAGK